MNCRDRRCVFKEGVECLAYCMYALSSDVSCEILVYKLATSIDTRIAFSGTLVLSIYHGAQSQLTISVFEI